MNPIETLLGALFGGAVGGSAKGLPKKSKKMKSDKMPVKGVAKRAKMPKRQYEDESFIGSPRNFNQFSPMNADIRNFMPSGYEDGAYMQSQGMLSPISSDIRNYQIPNFRGLQQTGQVMPWDDIPNNYTAGRTGYYQGSNPYLQGGGNPNLRFDERLRVR